MNKIFTGFTCFFLHFNEVLRSVKRATCWSAFFIIMNVWLHFHELSTSFSWTGRLHCYFAKKGGLIWSTIGFPKVIYLKTESIILSILMLIGRLSKASHSINRLLPLGSLIPSTLRFHWLRHNSLVSKISPTDMSAKISPSAIKSPPMLWIVVCSLLSLLLSLPLLLLVLLRLLLLLLSLLRLLRLPFLFLLITLIVEWFACRLPSVLCPIAMSAVATAFSAQIPSWSLPSTIVHIATVPSQADCCLC